LLVPLFFAYSGLNSQIGLLNSAWLWMVTLVIVVAACAGKGLAMTIATTLMAGPLFTLVSRTQAAATAKEGLAVGETT
jgi:Kef-type K+ transport system membrane component KefB